MRRPVGVKRKEPQIASYVPSPVEGIAGSHLPTLGLSRSKASPGSSSRRNPPLSPSFHPHCLIGAMFSLCASWAFSLQWALQPAYRPHLPYVGTEFRSGSISQSPELGGSFNRILLQPGRPTRQHRLQHGDFAMAHRSRRSPTTCVGALSASGPPRQCLVTPQRPCASALPMKANDYTAMWNAIKGKDCSEQPVHAVRPAAWAGIQARGG